MGRSPCCDKASVRRGPWSQEEDAVLRSFVERFGSAGNWIALPQKAGLRRCGKSCRLRWLNYLRPALRHGGFTYDEDNLILSLYGEIGSKWSVIASRLPGRTDNDVKNYWNTKLKKRYLATTRETTPPPPPPTGGDTIAAADSPSESDQFPPPPTPPVLVNLDIALDTVDDNDEFLHKLEQLYAELMRLIEQQSTTASPPAVDASMATSSSPLGTSPTASSAGSSMWPVDVHDTILLSESSISSSSSLFEFDDPYGAHALGVAQLPDSFQDLLASSYDDEVVAQLPDSFQDLLASSYDDEVIVTQELLYY